MVTFWALVKTIAMWVKLLRLLFGATFAKLGLLFISTSGHTAHDIDHCKTFSCYKQARLVVPKFDRTDPCKILMQYFRVCTFPVKPVFPPKRESVVTSKRKRKQQSTLFAIHKFNLPPLFHSFPVWPDGEIKGSPSSFKSYPQSSLTSLT